MACTSSWYKALWLRDKSKSSKLVLFNHKYREMLWLKQYLHLAFFLKYFWLLWWATNICLSTNLRALRTFCSSSERTYIHSNRLLLYVQKSVGDPQLGGSLSVHSSDEAVGLYNIQEGNSIICREGRINIKSVDSSVTKVASCVHPNVYAFQCVSLCWGCSVCVHVVVGWFRGSSQRGWRLRFRGAFLISPLIEQYIGCFRLKQENED